MIQVWTINILVTRSPGLTKKSQKGQKHHRKKAIKDKNQSRQNPQKRKYFNTPTIKVYDNMITWYRCGQSTFSSCDHVCVQRKAKMDKKHHITKAIKDTYQSGQNPQKRKYFNTPTIKVYDPMITWYRCGQSTFSSCDHVCGQRKAKMDKSTIGQKPQRIKIKADKIIKKRKYFNTPTIKVYDPMITWCRCGQSTFSLCDQVGGLRKVKMFKSTILQKPQKIKIKADKNPQKRKYFNTPTIKVYDHMITWYRCGQSTFSSCDHVGGQRKAKMDKSTIEQKPQKIKIKAYKTTKRENILTLQQSRCTIPWSHDTGVDNQHSRHAITWTDREKPKWTKAP